MQLNKIILTSLSVLIIIFSSVIFSSESSTQEELQQSMVFDQACIIMHNEGRKYLENKEKIAQSYGASALIEQHLKSQLGEYTQITGDEIEGVRKIVFEKGVILFKELSENQPRDLVNQCMGLVETIVRANI